METSVVASTLRPMGIGQLFDQSIRIYRRHFLKLIGIMALVQIPVGGLTLFFTILMSQGQMEMMSARNSADFFNPQYWGGFFGVMATSLVASVFQQLAMAAIVGVARGEYLGRTIRLLDAYRQVGRNLGPLLITLVLEFLLSIGIVIWMMVPCIGWFTGIGASLFFSMVVMPLTTVIVMVENQQGFEAIRRAWELLRRRFWWSLGLVMALTLFIQVITWGGVAAASLLISGISNLGDMIASTDQSILQSVFQTLLSAIVGLILSPLLMTAMTMLYFDLRVRLEGFDLALLAQNVLGQEANPADVVPTVPTTQLTSASLLTWEEMANFLIISIVGLAVYGILVGIVFVVMSLAMGLS